MQIKKWTILEILLIIISPLFAIFPIIFGMLKRKKSSFYIFLFLLSCMAFSLIPYNVDDLTRHYDNYLRLSSELIKNDKIFNYVLMTLKRFKMPKEILPFLSVALVNSIYIKIFLEITKSISKKRYYLCFFIFFMNIINFKLAASNIRMPIGSSLIILGIWYIYIGKLKKGLIVSFVSFGVHFMMIPYIFLIIIWILLKSTKKIKLKFLLGLSMILGTIFNEELIYKVFLIVNNILNLNLERTIQIYTEGYWAKDYFQDKSLNGIIWYWIVNFNNIFKLFYIILTKRKNFIENYIYLSFSLAFLLNSFPLIKNRYLFIGQILINFIFIIDISEKPKVQKSQKIYILVSFVVFVLGLYSQRDSYKETLFRNNIKPLVFILTQEITENDYIIKK